MARTLHARKRKPQHPAELKLERIRGIVDRLQRNPADEDVVSLFRHQLTDVELRSIYRLAGGKVGR